MNFEIIGGVKLFRPGIATELAVRREAEAALRKNHRAGEFKQRDQINAVLQELFRFYDSMLKESIPRIASRHLMEFVLVEYDSAADIEEKFRRQQLSNVESARWRELGPTFRRAAKYMAECVCMLAPNEAPRAVEHKLFELTDRCWICAEQMIVLSILSTQTFALFPDNTMLKLWPDADPDWFVLTLDHPSKYEAFGERIRRDTIGRKNYINETEIVYDRQRLADVLDDRFAASCGFTITKAMEFASNLNLNTIQPGSGFDVPFVSEQQIISALTEDVGLSIDEARCLLDGICLRKVKMLKEGRVAWKPKQEYRAYARPFFEFPHATGSHITWSRKMAEECIITLYTRLAQKQVPPEWQRGQVSEALEDYVLSITASFEDVVNKNLETAGIIARRFRSAIGQGTSSLRIPDDIGELDSLGYWEKYKLLIVGEDKFVKPTSEPATFRDDIDKFVGMNKNYVEQLKRKTEWVLRNADNVATALSRVAGFPDTVSVTHIAPVLVTYYPAFASCFISDVPCISLSELMSDIKQAGSWPYEPIHDK